MKEDDFKYRPLLDAAIRGLQFWLGSSVDNFFSGSSPLFVFNEETGGVCVDLAEGKPQSSLLLTANSLSWNVNVSVYNGCLMSNDTCVQLLTSPIKVCSANSSIVVPVEAVRIQEIYELRVAGMYYEQFGLRLNLSETILQIMGAFSNLLEESSVRYMQSMRGNNSCSGILISPSQFEVPSVSVSDLGLIYSGINFIKAMSLIGDCDNSWGAVEVEPVLQNFISKLNSSNMSECDSLLLASASGYLLSYGTLDPPVTTLDTCNISIGSLIRPEVFVPVGNLSLLDSVSGVIKTTSRPLLISEVAALSQEVVSPCPTSSPPQFPLECEEVGSDECARYPGCWISWGPCQSVFLGFYSPSGSFNQLPCPAIPPDQSFVQGNAHSACVSTCNNPDDILSNQTCQLVPPGRIRDRSCDIRTVSCEERSAGFLFTHANSCRGRWLSPGLGNFVSLPLGQDCCFLSVQSWVQTNSLSLNVGGEGALVPLLGSFGNYFIGIQYESSEYIRIVFAASNFEPFLIASPPVPHILNQWTHLACEINKTEVKIYLNGALLSNQNIVSIFPASPLINVRTSFDSTLVSQYLKLLNRVHYGPFSVNSSDLIIQDSFFNLYILKAFPEINLYNPNISQSAAIGFFGASPPGLRRPSFSQTLHNRKIFPTNNYCLSKPSLRPELCDATSHGWNPFACTCQLLPTTTSTSSRPFSTTSPSAAQSQQGAPSAQGLLSGVVISSLVLCAAFWCLIRKRASRRVKRVSQRCDIHSIPSTEFLFNDITFDEQISTLITN